MVAHFPVRLACVKRAASVDSEPGSNSHLKCRVLLFRPALLRVLTKCRQLPPSHPTSPRDKTASYQHTSFLLHPTRLSMICAQQYPAFAYGNRWQASKLMSATHTPFTFDVRLASRKISLDSTRISVGVCRLTSIRLTKDDVFGKSLSGFPYAPDQRSLNGGLPPRCRRCPALPLRSTP